MAKSQKKTDRTGMERRDFFRVSEDVLFDFKIVDNDTAERGSPEIEFDGMGSLGLVSELRRLDRDNRQTLSVIADKNRLLADYLHNLSAKVDLVARHALFSQNQRSEDRTTERINLSENGIAFASERAIYKGNYLVMRMIFLPEYVPVAVFAKVVRCIDKDNFHEVAAHFHRLSESNRRTLARQILKAQANQKKARLAETIRKPS